MGNIFYLEAENNLIIWLQQFMSEPLVKILSFITNFGDELILVMVLSLLYYCLNKELGKKVAVLLSFTNIVYPGIKAVAKRLRPYIADPNVKCLKAVSKDGDIMDPITQGYSFPSGHCANAMVTYGTILWNVKKVFWTVVLVALTLTIGISRFALGVHYPTDVLAGYAIGFVCILLYGLSEKKLGRYVTFIILDVLGIIGFFFVRTNDYFTGYGMLLGSTLAIFFEEKVVHFKETKNFFACLIRILVGGGIFFGLNALMKLPFSEEFLNNGTLAALSIRAARYAINIFVCLGLYPLCFQWAPFRIGEKKAENTEKAE